MDTKYEASVSVTEQPIVVSKWSYRDISWSLSLWSMGSTAIATGILFLPIKAGSGGFLLLVILAILAFPMTWLAHKNLAQFVLSAKEPQSDITNTVEEYFREFVAPRNYIYTT